MSRTFSTLLAGLLLLGSCSVEVSRESAAAGSNPAAAPAMPADTLLRDVGCYGCIFEAEDAAGCQLAVQVDGKAYRVTGVNADAHALGLCGSKKQAEISGAVEGETFVATAFSLRQ